MKTEKKGRPNHEIEYPRIERAVCLCLSYLPQLCDKVEMVDRIDS